MRQHRLLLGFSAWFSAHRADKVKEAQARAAAERSRLTALHAIEVAGEARRPGLGRPRLGQGSRGRFAKLSTSSPYA